jgi:hypothetical protein
MKDTKVVNLNVRIPPRLHAQLVKQARANNRSLNGEIIEQLEKRSGLPAESAARAAESEIRPELRGIMEVLAAVADVAGRSRFGFDTLYSPDTVPDWLDDADGYAVAAAAAARVLDALRPGRPADSGDADSLAEQAEINAGHGHSVAQMILNRIARAEPSDPRTDQLRHALGPLAERIEPDTGASGFETHWIRARTAEQKARIEAARRQETDDEEN